MADPEEKRSECLSDLSYVLFELQKTIHEASRPSLAHWLPVYLTVATLLLGGISVYVSIQTRLTSVEERLNINIELLRRLYDKQVNLGGRSGL